MSVNSRNSLGRKNYLLDLSGDVYPGKNIMDASPSLCSLTGLKYTYFFGLFFGVEKNPMLQ